MQNSTDNLNKFNQKVFAFPSVKGNNSSNYRQNNQRPISNNLKRILVITPFENSYDQRNFFTPSAKKEQSFNNSRLNSANHSRQRILGQTFSTMSAEKFNSRKDSNNVTQSSEIFVTKAFNEILAGDQLNAAIGPPSRQFSSAGFRRPKTVNLKSFIFKDTLESRLITPNDTLLQELRSPALENSKAFSKKKPSQILGLNIHYNLKNFPIPNVAIEKDLYTQHLGTESHKVMEDLERIATAGKTQKRRSIYRMMDDPKSQEHFRRFTIKKDADMEYHHKLDYQHQQAIVQQNNETDFEALIRTHSKELMVVVDIPSFRLTYAFIQRETTVGQGRIDRFPDRELKIIIAGIRQKFKLNPEFRHLYLLNGTSIFELKQIPLSENIAVLSNATEFIDCDQILRFNFVNEFYHYGKREYELSKRRTQYSRAAISSGLLSQYEHKTSAEDKIKDVLSKILPVSSPNASDLERLDKFLEGKPDNIKYSQLIRDLLQREDKLKSAGNATTKGLKPDLNDNFSNIVTPLVNTEDDSSLDQEANKSNQTDILQERISSYLKQASPYSSPKFDQINHIYQIYKSDMKNTTISNEEVEQDSLNGFQKMQEGNEEFETAERNNLQEILNELDPLIKGLKNPHKELDYFQERKLRKQDSSRKNLEPTASFSKMVEFDAPGKSSVSQNAEGVGIGGGKNHVQNNIKCLENKKSHIVKLHKTNRELFEKNIPKYMKDLNLSRKELHLIWTIYKALCEVSSQRHDNYNVTSGIDYHSFRNGIYQVFLQSDKIAEKIFHNIDINYSGFLNWEEFLQAMVKIRAHTLKDKIDLFIKLADEDGNKMLSKDEIFNLCKICLEKFIKQNNDDFLESLCEYFTKFIFQSVGINLADEIPLQKLKDCILEGGDDSTLLAMFCGADM